MHQNQMGEALIPLILVEAHRPVMPRRNRQPQHMADDALQTGPIGTRPRFSSPLTTVGREGARGAVILRSEGAIPNAVE